MARFDLWYEALIFVSVFAGIIIIPCGLIALISCKMFNRLGQHPSQAAVIQFGSFLQLIVIEAIALGGLIAFFHFFET